MNGMWLMIFWIALICSVHSRPQNVKFDDSSPDVETEGTTRVTLLPFYGGGKGQSLQIIQSANGSVTTNIIKTPEQDKNNQNKEEEVNPAELEYPQLPSKFEKKFDDHIKLINANALNILSLQSKAKNRGELSADEQRKYQENMDEISEATAELTKLQEKNSDLDLETREGLGAWFERKNKLQAQKRVNKTNEVEQLNNKDNTNNQTKKEQGSKWWNKNGEENKKGEQEKKKEKEEETGEKEEENGEEGGNDTVEINLPPEEASVAEAMPVGLAVAGEGGVAASKPVATAVVGPNGLAIARPIATAIAGVRPDQALVPIYAEGYVGGTKPKRNGSQSQKPGSADEFLKKIISKFHDSAIADQS